MSTAVRRETGRLCVSMTIHAPGDPRGASRQRQMQSESYSEPVLAYNGCGHRGGSVQVSSVSDIQSCQPEGATHTA